MTAVAGPSTQSYLGRAADFVRPDFHQVNLRIEGYLKTERNFKLDEGELICLFSSTRYWS
jgi:cleavage and polyadenylation specificity factor subunit 4